MSFGNALTGFMRGLYSNGDPFAKMRKYEIERQVKDALEGKSASLGVDDPALWMSDVSPQQQEMLHAQTSDMGLHQFNGKNFVGETDALAAANQYNAAPAKMQRLADVYGRFGDAEKAMNYGLAAERYQRDAAQQARAEEEYTRKERERAGTEGRMKALRALLAGDYGTVASQMSTAQGDDYRYTYDPANPKQFMRFDREGRPVGTVAIPAMEDAIAMWARTTPDQWAAGYQADRAEDRLNRQLEAEVENQDAISEYRERVLEQRDEHLKKQMTQAMALARMRGSSGAGVAGPTMPEIKPADRINALKLARETAAGYDDNFFQAQGMSREDWIRREANSYLMPEGYGLQPAAVDPAAVAASMFGGAKPKAGLSSATPYLTASTMRDWVSSPQEGLDRLRGGSLMYENVRTGERISETEFNRRLNTSKAHHEYYK